MQRALHDAFKNLANALRTKLECGIYSSVLLSLQDHGPSSAGFFLSNREHNFCLSMHVGLLKAVLDSYDI